MAVVHWEPGGERGARGWEKWEKEEAEAEEETWTAQCSTQNKAQHRSVGKSCKGLFCFQRRTGPSDPCSVRSVRASNVGGEGKHSRGSGRLAHTSCQPCCSPRTAHQMMREDVAPGRHPPERAAEAPPPRRRSRQRSRSERVGGSEKEKASSEGGGASQKPSRRWDWQRLLAARKDNSIFSSGLGQDAYGHSSSFS
ncbi:unnamed protein product, partial [Prorocentrum cordatum]